MEYTELADYPLPAGRLTEWVPRVDDDQWALDSRGLSLDRHGIRDPSSLRRRGRTPHHRRVHGSARGVPNQGSS